jgi:hypothetical protein
MNNEECPYLRECKLEKVIYRCYNNKKYTSCIIYSRLKSLGYDIEHEDLAPEVENIGLIKKVEE